MSSAAKSSSIRLGAISFINTIPVYYPILNASDAFRDRLELHYDVPAALNNKMRDGLLDVSPVSSACYLAHQDRFVLLDDLSVSSPGAVESVIFISKKRLGAELLDLAQIGVPDDSETSTNLLRHLIQDSLGEQSPDFKNWFKTYPACDYRQTLEEFGAALIIGDNALLIHEDGIPEGYHCYDLSTLWHKKTGLPFTFAVWVANKTWVETNPADFVELTAYLVSGRERFFNDPILFDKGVEAASRRCRISKEQIRHYFTDCLDYRLTADHKAALTKFEATLITPFVASPSYVR